MGVNDALPPIPKDLPFKAKDKLTNLKADINAGKRLLQKPEEFRKRQTKDGRQYTEEIVKDEIEKLEKQFRQIIEDYT